MSSVTDELCSIPKELQLIFMLFSWGYFPIWKDIFSWVNKEPHAQQPYKKW